MTTTYIALAQTTLSSATSTVTFSSIPATYRDLIVVMNGIYTTGDGNVFIRFNGSSSNYSNVTMFGTGSGTGSVVAGTTSILGGGFNTLNRSSSTFQVFDYAQTNKHKTVLNRTDNVSDATYAWAGRWADTAAVTTLSVHGSQTMAIGTTISLYGVN